MRDLFIKFCVKLLYIKYFIHFNHAAYTEFQCDIQIISQIYDVLKQNKAAFNYYGFPAYHKNSDK